MDINKVPLYFANRKALKDTSKDDSLYHTEYMTECIKEAVYFDGVVKDYYKNLGQSTGKSIDALINDDKDGLVFIEFKNGKIGAKEAYEIQEKVYNSVLIHTDLTNEKISNMREKNDFFLVYNSDKHTLLQSDSFNIIETAITEFGKTPIISFGLDKFDGYLFRRVFTYTKQEFDEEFVKKRLTK